VPFASLHAYSLKSRYGKVSLESSEGTKMLRQCVRPMLVLCILLCASHVHGVVIDQASVQNLNMPTYTGDDQDYNYLKNYILDLMANNYGLPPSDFTSATVEGTTHLRNLVHYLNNTYQPRKRPSSTCTKSIGCMFKERAGANCGFISTTLYDIYRALGYEVKRYDVIDGTLNGPLKYRDSHVFNEVYIPALGKYILQDATYNVSVTDCHGGILSWQDIRNSLLLMDQDVCLDDSGGMHTNLNPQGHPSKRQEINLFDDYYLGTLYSARRYDGTREMSGSILGVSNKTNNASQYFSSSAEVRSLASACSCNASVFSDDAQLLSCVTCLNATKFAYGFITSSLDGRDKGFLIQYTNASGTLAILDPLISNFQCECSYDYFAYWNLGSKGFVRSTDKRYMKTLRIALPGKSQVVSLE